MSYSHSRKPDLPVTHRSPLSTWLSVLFFFSSRAKTTLSGHGYGVCWWRRQHYHRNCPIPIIVCALYCRLSYLSVLQQMLRQGSSRIAPQTVFQLN